MIDIFTGKKRELLIQEYEYKLRAQEDRLDSEIDELKEEMKLLYSDSACKSTLIEGLCREAAIDGSPELRRLAERVMFFTALRFEENEVAEEQFNVLEALDSLVAERRQEADERGITLRGQIKSIRDTKAMLKKDGLMEVLRIMISEALRCTAEGDSVMLVCEQVTPRNNEELAFCFTVKDSGADRMKDDFSPYFEPFGKERGEESTPDRVELAILVKLCDLIDADLNVNNGDDYGMIFTVTVGGKKI